MDHHCATVFLQQFKYIFTTNCLRVLDNLVLQGLLEEKVFLELQSVEHIK